MFNIHHVINMYSLKVCYRRISTNNAASRLREKDGIGGVGPGSLLVLFEHSRSITLAAAILEMTDDVAIEKKERNTQKAKSYRVK